MLKALTTIAVYFCIVVAGLCSVSCKDACDELDDLCRKCSSDNKSSCEEMLSVCEIGKGPARKDCCEVAVDVWEADCK